MTPLQVVLLSEITPGKLGLFPDIDAWVQARARPRPRVRASRATTILQLQVIFSLSRAPACRARAFVRTRMCKDAHAPAVTEARSRGIVTSPRPPPA